MENGINKSSRHTLTMLEFKIEFIVYNVHKTLHVHYIIWFQGYGENNSNVSILIMILPPTLLPKKSKIANNKPK